MSTSVSEHLQQQHGVTIGRGGKGICPFCRKDTFSVRGDDSVGKCFHPACGRYITSGGLERGQGGALYAILAQIRDDCHKCLQEQSKANVKGTAYHFIVVERRIHPDVVRDLTELGAVRPKLDVDALFKPELERLRCRREEITNELCELRQQQQAAGGNRGGGRPARSSPEGRLRAELDRLRDEHRFLIQAREQLKKVLHQAAGWVVFCHTDASHRVRSLRFRQPAGKKFLSYTPFSSDKHRRNGLFGHALFRPYKDDSRQQGNRLIVVEGEFNLLQIHSLAVRTAGPAEGRDTGLYASWIAAAGSSSSPDCSTVRDLLKSPGAVRPLVVVQDNDEAGERMVGRLSEDFTLEVSRPPATGSDVDDFIRSHGDEHLKAWEALQQLLAARCTRYRSFEALATQVFRTRQSKGEEDNRREFEVNKEVADIVVEDLTDRGAFYREARRPYYFRRDNRSLIALDSPDDAVACTLDSYGLNQTERTFSYVWKATAMQSLKRGQQTTIHRFSHYARDTNTLYVFDHANGIYRVTGDRIDHVENGTDAVLFLENPKNERFCILDEVHEDDLFTKHLVAPINFDDSGALTVDEQRFVVSLWFYSTFFGSIISTRALLGLFGPKGSGKTFYLKQVGWLLFGSQFNVSDLQEKKEDFQAVITNSHLSFFDNADSKIDWLENALAVCATGGTVSKRALFTTNTLVDYPINTFVGITARTPYFRRDDVADRLLVMWLKRFEGESFVSEDELKTGLLRNRDRIMTGVLHHLQRIVRALGQTAGRSYKTAFRLADFATFALRIADAKGDDARQLAEGVLRKMSAEQNEFALASLPLVGVLRAWLEIVGNSERELPVDELHTELARTACTRGLQYPCKNGISLGVRLTNLEANLKTAFGMKVNKDPHSKQKRYSFKRDCGGCGR